MSYRWWSSSLSDRGQRRKVNEDAYLSNSDAGVWVVADGMGGHSRGDKASRYVVDAFRDMPEFNNLDDKVDYARRCLHSANRKVLDESALLEEEKIMGSTVAVLVVHHRFYACLWAGDSRVYLLRGGTLQQLTKDHSVVQKMIDAGEIDATEAGGHPAVNRITRAVGVHPELVIDEVRGSIRDGDMLLVCSDGLVSEVEDDEIAATLNELDCVAAAQELIDLSLERGARDNVTVQVVQVEETTGVDWEVVDSTAINYHLRKRTSTQLRAS